jgi:hydroxyacylglutathione hydrolase
VTVEPQNEVLSKRVQEIKNLRDKGKPTVPSTIGLEKSTNPFLRPMSRDIQANLNMLGAELVDVFAETRRRKDNF